jgi:hypothetical protein
MDDYFEFLNPEERAIFLTIARHVAGMGYKSKKDQTSALGYTFTHRKVKRRLLRFSSAQGKPVLRIKFYAAPYYSNYFHEAIRLTIEEYDYRYTGCYGCEKCDGTQGYRYRYPDGREYFRCGTELIELTDFRDLPLSELLEMLTLQHEYFLCTPQSV